MIILELLFLSFYFVSGSSWPPYRYHNFSHFYIGHIWAIGLRKLAKESRPKMSRKIFQFIFRGFIFELLFKYFFELGLFIFSKYFNSFIFWNLSFHFQFVLSFVSEWVSESFRFDLRACFQLIYNLNFQNIPFRLNLYFYNIPIYT